MNVIVISPYFPFNFQRLNQRLKEEGVNVLGIGSEPYEQLGPYLQDQLTEYYRVDNLLDREAVARGVAFFYHKYGKIDRVESNNEFWLELDAYLRQEFNIFGLKPAELEHVKYKSKMKAMFKQAGAPVVEGLAVENLKELDQAIRKLKYPVVAKPDNGVGTGGTYRLDSAKDLAAFKKVWDQKTPYFIECFVEAGVLCTYDGIVDDEGRIVFEGSFDYNAPTLDLLNDEKDLAYTISNKIDPKLRKIGRKIVKTFGHRGRWFHIEFFRQKNGDYITLEYNARVPGGNCVDVYNTSYSMDFLEVFAKVLTGQKLAIIDQEHPYTVNVGRHNNRHYRYSDADIKAKYTDELQMISEMPDAFADLQGNWMYTFNTPSQEVAQQIVADLTARA